MVLADTHLAQSDREEIAKSIALLSALDRQTRDTLEQLVTDLPGKVPTGYGFDPHTPTATMKAVLSSQRMAEEKAELDRKRSEDRQDKRDWTYGPILLHGFINAFSIILTAIITAGLVRH